MDTSIIVIGSDHAGFALKEYIMNELDNLGIRYHDVGTHSAESVDYPVYGAKVALAVSKKEFQRGIAICGTGIGISIAANRFKGVRAALCVNEEMARMARQHNNANVLILGGRIVSDRVASAILRVWLETPFEGGRHEKRVQQLDEI